MVFVRDKKIVVGPPAKMDINGSIDLRLSDTGCATWPGYFHVDRADRVAESKMKRQIVLIALSMAGLDVSSDDFAARIDSHNGSETKGIDSVGPVAFRSTLSQ